MDKTPMEEFKDRGQKARAILDQLFEADHISHREYLLLRETIDTYEGELLKAFGVSCMMGEKDVLKMRTLNPQSTILYTMGIVYTWGENHESH